MKPNALLLSILLMLQGCTTMEPVVTGPEDVAQQIRASHLAKGDDVAIVTADGTKHRFKITAIDATTISGKNVSIPIDTIVGLKSREFSAGNTVVLAGGITLTMLVLFYAALASTAFMVGG
jgi:hypothetical protein